MSWIYIFLILLGVAVYAVVAFSQLLQFYYLLHPYKVCLVSTRINTVAPVISEILSKFLKDAREYSFVELGSGRAQVSRFVAKTMSFKEVIAVEGDLITHLSAKLVNLVGRSKLNFVLSDIFKYTSPDKSVIYCYLFPKLLNRLHANGYFKGKLILSLTFNIDGVEPTECFEVKNFQKMIYVYDFRS